MVNGNARAIPRRRRRVVHRAAQPIARWRPGLRRTSAMRGVLRIARFARTFTVLVAVVRARADVRRAASAVRRSSA